MLRQSMLLVLFVLMAFTVASGQNTTLSGTVTDSIGHPLPYALIFIKSTSYGASANAQGVYSMVIPLNTYTVSCKSMGYQTVEKTITLKANGNTLDFKLNLNTYNLNTLNVVYKDPALDIIRKTIARRAFFRNQIKDFRCRVYIKGGILLDTVKAKMFGQVISDTNELKRTRFLYLSESLSDYYQKGKKTKEVIIASRVSGGFATTFNTNQFLQTDFLENKVNGILSQRPFISPIADNGPYYYKYTLLGDYKEGRKHIYKISVTPKRHNEPCLSGYVLVEDSIFRLAGVNLLATRESGIEIIDTLKYKQEFIDINDSIMMPAQMHLHFHLKFLSVGFNGNFLGVYNNYKVNTNFNDKIFDNTLYKIADTADKKDKKVWDTLRPVQLTTSEKTDYTFKDSVATKHNSRKYLDSIDSIGNHKFKTSNWAYNYTNTWLHLKAGGHLTFIYNIVEGVGITLPAYFEKVWKDSRKLNIEPFARYGLSDKAYKYGLSSTYLFNQKNDAFIKLNAAHDVLPVDEDNFARFITAEAEQNTLFRQNFLKWYQKNFVNLTIHARVMRGVYASETIEYAYRAQLYNHADYSLFTPNHNDFTPNNFLPTGSYGSNQVLSTTALMIHPFEKYVELPHKKMAIGSNWPVIKIQCKSALPNLLNSNTEYILLTVGLKHSISLGIKGQLTYGVSAGSFINNHNLTLYDAFHFVAAPWFFNNVPFNSFVLLQPYSASTTQQFIEAHAEYKLKGFITNKIPGFNKLKWYLEFGADYLNTPELGHYLEAYAGVENIFKIFNVRYYYPVIGNHFGASGNVHINIPITSFVSGFGN